MKRLIAAVVAAVALVAAGVSVALIGGSSASQAAGTSSSAYGITATGAFPFDRQPAVVSDDGRLHQDSAGSIPDNPLLTGGLMEVSAANGDASSTLADLNVGDGILSQLPQDLSKQMAPLCDALQQVDLSAISGQITGPDGTLLPDVLGPIVDGASTGGVDLSLITALDLSQLTPANLSGLCDLLAGKTGLVDASAITAECHGRSGSTTVADLTALGLPVRIDTNKPGSSVSIPGVVTITANRQTSNADGTFTVDGLVLNLFDREEIVITSATCGKYTAAHHPSPHPSEHPTPVHTSLPVTG